MQYIKNIKKVYWKDSYESIKKAGTGIPAFVILSY